MNLGAKYKIKLSIQMMKRVLISTFNLRTREEGWGGGGGGGGDNIRSTVLPIQIAVFIVVPTLFPFLCKGT